MEVKNVMITFLFVVGFFLIIQYFIFNFSSQTKVELTIVDNKTLQTFNDLNNQTENMVSIIRNTQDTSLLTSFFSVSGFFLVRVLPTLMSLIIQTPLTLLNWMIGPNSFLALFVPSEVLSVVFTVVFGSILIVIVFWIIGGR